MFSFSFKKLLFLSAIAVFLLAVLFSVAKIIHWQKTRITTEAARLECLGNISKMNEEQIIEEINTLSFATVEESGKINQLMHKYLRCQFFEDPFGEQLEETKSLITALRILEERKLRTFENLAEYLKTAEDNRGKVMWTTFFPLIVYEKERICPAGEEISTIVDGFINLSKEIGGEKRAEKARNIISNYCEQIDRYSRDDTVITKEVYEFKKWSDDPEIKTIEYKWKTILASRFGGETKALEVCDNLVNPTERKDCQKWVDSINSWPVRQIREEGCTNFELKEAKDLICQLLNQ